MKEVTGVADGPFGPLSGLLLLWPSYSSCSLLSAATGSTNGPQVPRHIVKIIKERVRVAETNGAAASYGRLLSPSSF